MPFFANRFIQAYCPIRIRDASGEPSSERDSGRVKYNDTILLELVAIAYDSRQLGTKRVPAHPQRVRLPNPGEVRINLLPLTDDPGCSVSTSTYKKGSAW